MNKCFVIDKDGFYTVTIFLNKKEGIDYSDCIDIEPKGFLIPKWDGKQWIESYVKENN